jgi:hypothetical protein
MWGNPNLFTTTGDTPGTTAEHSALIVDTTSVRRGGIE